MESIDVNKVIFDFISEMKYFENAHVLGCYFYGSYLTGLNNENSDIDLHIVFDNSDTKHLIRGVKYSSGIKTGQLNALQQYAISKYKEPLPRLDSETVKEYISIISNRMEKLEKCAADNSPNFIHLYHLTIEKIRKFYHDVNGLAQVQTSKVYRVYTDEQYRESYSGYEIPEPEFIAIYFGISFYSFYFFYYFNYFN